MATFATTAEIKAIQTGFANHADAMIDSSRKAVYALIISALTEGGYNVATIVATPTVWGFLTLLEIRMAALDLLGGGAAAPVALAGGKNWQHWSDTIERWLTQLRTGKAVLVNDTSGAITAAPQTGQNDGIYGETRNAGINLDAPELWTETDNLEEN
jgi:hypothetical protein